MFILICMHLGRWRTSLGRRFADFIIIIIIFFFILCIHLSVRGAFACVYCLLPSPIVLDNPN